MAISQYVIIQLGSQEFALDISNVGSINDYQNITLAPNAPKFIEGVINLRGDIIPIINLSVRFNIESTKKLSERRIIVVEIENKLIGFLVDDASNAISLDSSDIKDTPDIIRGNDGDYIDGVCKVGEGILLLVNLEKVLNHSQIEQLKKMEVDI